MSQIFGAVDEAWHPSAVTEEWTFSWWAADGSVAGWTMYRLVPNNHIWYCFGLLGRELPLLHVAEYEITRRKDPLIAKADSLWAEFVCDAPFEQWTLGNETYAVELDDAADGLGRAYGRAVPLASDLEWYASEPVAVIGGAESAVHEVIGYEQRGALTGVVETVDGSLEISDVVAHRVHRWSKAGQLSSQSRETGTEVLRDARGRPLRLAFRFPDGSTWDRVLTPSGFRSRTVV